MVSANTNKQQVEIQSFLKNLVDATEPQPANIVELRLEERLSRALPALVMPWGTTGPVVEQATFVVTKNLSVTGTAWLSQQTIDTDDVLVGLWNRGGCRFVKGTVRYRKRIECGFWQIGVELLRMVTPGEVPVLKRLSELAERLK